MALHEHSRNQTCERAEQRFPNAKEVQLFRLIWKHFVQQRSFTCPWFTQSGARAITRHDLNERDTEGTHEPLINSFLTEGVYFGVGSRPVLQRTSPDAETWWAVGAGNRTDCFYTAKKREPDNDFILDAEHHGLEDCVQLTDDCPSDVIALLVSNLNNFHGGAGNTHIQIMKEVAPAEKAWGLEKKKTHVTARGIKKGQASHEEQYWNFIKGNNIWSKMWRDWDDFECCKITYHYPTSLKMFDEWASYFGKKTQWSSQDLIESTEFFECMRDFCVMLKMKFSDAPADLKQVFIWEQTKMLLPMSRDCTPMMKFKDGKKTMKEANAITKLSVNMGESIMYKQKKQAAPAIKRELEESTAEEPAPKRLVIHAMPKGKAKAKASAAAKAKAGAQAKAQPKRSGQKTAQACCAGEEEVLSSTTEGGREKMFFDDVFQVLVVASKGYGVDLHFQDAASHQCMAFALRFCYESHIDMGTGHDIKRWSLMRAALIKFNESQRKVVAVDLDVTSVVNRLANVLKEQATPDALSPFRILVESKAADMGFAARLEEFLKVNNLSEPLDMCEAAQDLQRKLWSELKGTSLIGPTTISTFVSTFASHVEEVFPSSWTQLASTVMALSSNTGSAASAAGAAAGAAVPEEAKDLFTSMEEVENLSSFRTKLLFKITLFFATNKGCVVGGVAPSQLERMGQQFESFAAADALLASEKPDTKSWINHWTDLFTQLATQEPVDFERDAMVLIDAMVERRRLLVSPPKGTGPAGSSGSDGAVRQSSGDAAPTAEKDEEAKHDFDSLCDLLNSTLQEAIDMDLLDTNNKAKLQQFYGNTQCEGGEEGGFEFTSEAWQDLLVEIESHINKACLTSEKGHAAVRVMKDLSLLRYPLQISKFFFAILSLSFRGRLFRESGMFKNLYMLPRWYCLKISRDF